MTSNSDIDKKSGTNKVGLLSVLVVEDVKLNRELIWILLNDEGHNVSAVENGEKALNLLQKKHFNVVLLDIRLPGLTGLDIAHIIRSCERGDDTDISLPEGLYENLSNRLKGNHLIIIALTGNATREDRKLCLEAEMDDYIVPERKPYVTGLRLSKIRLALKLSVSQKPAA